jgi:hypothetical protein
MQPDSETKGDEIDVKLGLLALLIRINIAKTIWTGFGLSAITVGRDARDDLPLLISSAFMHHPSRRVPALGVAVGPVDYSAFCVPLILAVKANGVARSK